jgi:hypothetical protein
MLSVARILVGTLAMAAVMVPFAQNFSASGSLLIAGAGAVMGAIVYFGVTLVLRSEEIWFVWRRVRG